MKKIASLDVTYSLKHMEQNTKKFKKKNKKVVRILNFGLLMIRQYQLRKYK